MTIIKFQIIKYMESLTKIKELKEKMSELQNLLEDFTNLYESKKIKQKA